MPAPLQVPPGRFTLRIELEKDWQKGLTDVIEGLQMLDVKQGPGITETSSI